MTVFLRASTRVFALSLVLMGCSASTTSPTRPCTVPRDCALTETCIDGTCTARPATDASVDGSGFDATLPDGGHRTLVSIAITPDSPTVATHDGLPSGVDLDLEASFDDGSTETIAAGFWSAAASVVGDVNSTSGVFTATGSVAGEVEVSVDALGMSASTTVHVTVEHTILVDPAPADAATVHRMVYADGAVIEYDRAAHALRALLPGGGTARIEAPGGVTIVGDVTVTGRIDAAGDVTAGGGVSLLEHRHTNVQTGGGLSGPPQQ